MVKLVSGSVPQAEKACAKPAGIGTGRVIEVVISFFRCLYPLVRNKEAELIPIDEGAI